MKLFFLAKNREWHAPDPVPGLRVITYDTHRQGGGEAIHPYLRRFEACVLEGQAVFEFASNSAKMDGFLIGS